MSALVIATSAYALALVLVRDLVGAAVLFVVAIGSGGAVVAYFLNANVWYNDQEIGKVDLLGIERRCRRDELVRMETSYSPQPTVNFIRKDGRRPFRINKRLWTDAQLRTLEDVIGH